MELTEKDVIHVARLARLALTEEERKTCLVQLGRVLGHIQKLSVLDTTDVLPTTHVAKLSNVWREDEVRPFLNTESILANAPDREEIFFKVKKVIE